MSNGHTVTASSRIRKGRPEEGGLLGREEEQLSWEKFNNVASMKTYNTWAGKCRGLCGA